MDASGLSDRAWLFLARAAADGAAAGDVDSKKVLEMSQAEAVKIPRKGALLLLQQV